MPAVLLYAKPRLTLLLVLLGSLDLSVMLVIVRSNIAHAHANLLRSVPAANAALDASPSQIQLWFSEAPEPRFATIALLDRSGRRASLPDNDSSKGAPDGRILASCHVVLYGRPFFTVGGYLRGYAWPNWHIPGGQRNHRLEHSDRDALWHDAADQACLLVPLLGLAAANLLFLKRRLASATDESEPVESALPWYRHILQTVSGEIVLVTAVLLVTSVLTNLSPKPEVSVAPLTVREQASGLQATLFVSPGQPGMNTFDLYLRDSAGRPVSNTEKVALILTLQEQDLG